MSTPDQNVNRMDVVSAYPKLFMNATYGKKRCPGCDTYTGNDVCDGCRKPLPNATVTGGAHHPDCRFPHESCVCGDIAREFGAEKVDAETYGMAWCEECSEYHD